MSPRSALRAIVIGKFLPPHAGHHALIEHAGVHAGNVQVFVCDGVGQRPTASERAKWLARRHPDVEVHVVPDICGWHGSDPCPPGCSPRWAAHLLQQGFGGWDLVVSSENYGIAFAKALGARHLSFDVSRGLSPCSGTLIREDLRSGWRWLDPVVRAGLTRKVVVLGAESTGTTTLARALAQKLGGGYVAEFGRSETLRLSQECGSVWDIEWTSADFARIASGQRSAEARGMNDLTGARASFGENGPWLVCDTDVLATSLWRERYLGEGSPAMIQEALWGSHPPDLYILTSHSGVPFTQDGIRDGEHLRSWMTGRFREELSSTAVPWIEVEGSPTQRINAVLDAIGSLPPLLRSVRPEKY